MGTNCIGALEIGAAVARQAAVANSSSQAVQEGLAIDAYRPNGDNQQGDAVHFK
jgi:hypothetical protein